MKPKSYQGKFKPTVSVDAMRFVEEDWPDLSAWLPKEDHMFVVSVSHMSLHVRSEIALVGDWIVRLPGGHFEVLTNAEFEKHYREVT